MEYCLSEDCGDYAVTPILTTPCIPIKCRESVPMCYPCLPACPKGQVIYCCERRPREKPRLEYPDCCNQRPEKPTPEQSSTPQYCCPTCNQPTCKPIKTKYVIPCYRYEDGRIEQYKPTQQGRLPMSAYCRNGMQDQIHGYRGAIKYLCAASDRFPCSCTVYTAIEPIRKIYSRITHEVSPVKKRKDKK